MFINKHLFKNKYLLISMIIHKKYVVPEYFDYIKNNQKTCYINLNIGSFSEMKKGDIIIWFYNNENEENMIKTQIVKIRKFKSFYNGIKNCRLKKIYPNLSNIQDAINLHINNENNLSDEIKYGVICIEFQSIL
jgi:ASC-1-like (ASCH) protein